MENVMVAKEKAEEIVSQLELNSEWGDIAYKITEHFHNRECTYEVINLVAEIGQAYDVEFINFSDICCEIKKRKSTLNEILSSKIVNMSNTCNIKDRIQNIKIMLDNGYIDIEAVIEHTK